MPHFFNILSEHERFIHRYMPMSHDMYVMAFRLLQQVEEAEDVVQDVLLTLYEKRHELPPEASERSYVLAMVRNRCIDRLRTPRTEPLAPPGYDENSDILSDSEPLTSSPEAQLEAADYLKYMLGLLPAQAAQIVQLRLIEGLSFNDIGRILGITPGNARVILSRTLRNLQQTNSKNTSP